MGERIGFVWKNPIMMVTVRLTRHTFLLIERAEDFTVSIPSADMGKEPVFCGRNSGRDYDKYKECHLQLTEAQRTITPSIKVPGLHFECKMVYRTALNPAYLNEEYDKGIYPKKDYHTLYFGETMDSRLIESSSFHAFAQVLDETRPHSHGEFLPPISEGRSRFFSTSSVKADGRINGCSSFSAASSVLPTSSVLTTSSFRDVCKIGKLPPIDSRTSAPFIPKSNEYL